MKLNTAYLNNKRVSDDEIFLCTLRSSSLITTDDTPSKRAKNFKLQPRRSAFIISYVLAHHQPMRLPSHMAPGAIPLPPNSATAPSITAQT
eukprot:scaffold7978_cov145-Skeletonema_menzelii.AAC.2